MRTLLLAGACILVISGPALACRGTDEFPQAFEQLERRLGGLLRQLDLGADHAERLVHDDDERQILALLVDSEPDRQRLLDVGLRVAFLAVA